MERTIGATELRQRLTDVLQAVREERVAYIIETFERSQAALINLEEYRQFRQYQEERAAFLQRLMQASAQNAERNHGLTDEEIEAIIEQAREDVAGEER